jgi:hypothetical protein
MSRCLLLFLALAALRDPAAAAGDAALDRATLRGLAAVNVVVDQIAADLQSAGITPSVVRAHIEDRLTAANIKVDSSKQEFVAVRFTGVRDRRGPFAVSVSMGAYQPVTLTRDPKVRTATQTWEIETVLLADPKQLFRAAMESVDELTRGFINAYRSVNQ